MKDVRRIWFSPYSLTPRRSLGAHASQSSKTREGSLLKFEFESGAIGYSDLHPWTELGDDSLPTQLKKLADKNLTQLSTRSIELARKDATARAESRSVFEGLSVPNSHFLFTDASALTISDAAGIEAEGFKVLKAKAGKNLIAERKALEAVFGAEGNLSLKLRLDFNSVLDLKTAEEWLLSLSPSVREKIEFCEDPCAFDPAAWRELHKRTGIDFYCDLESESLFQTEQLGVKGLILKPARQNPRSLRAKSYSLVVTSYLDHPLGQMSASFEAACLNQSYDVGVCGLLSHVAYEASPYSERIPARGPALLPDLDQPGFGFGDLLQAEAWKEIGEFR